MPTVAQPRPRKLQSAPNMKEFLAALVIVLAIGFTVFYPIAIIWSLNLLFGLTIPYTFSTWCATMVISGLFAARVTVNKN